MASVIEHAKLLKSSDTNCHGLDLDEHAPGKSHTIISRTGKQILYRKPKAIPITSIIIIITIITTTITITIIIIIIIIMMIIIITIAIAGFAIPGSVFHRWL